MLWNSLILVIDQVFLDHRAVYSDNTAAFSKQGTHQVHTQPISFENKSLVLTENTPFLKIFPLWQCILC